MSSLRSSRSIAALQVDSLRFSRNSIPENGGVLTVNNDGSIAPASVINVAAVETGDLTVTGALDIGGATLEINNLNLTDLTVTGVLDVSDGTVIADDITAR